jgi:CIC family chloride channel protein
MDDPVPPQSTADAGGALFPYLVLATIVGVATGTIGSLFHLALNTLQQWPMLLRWQLEGPLLVLTAALITMIATVTAVALVRHVAPEAGGSGVQEVEGAMAGLRHVHGARVLPVKFFGGIAAIGGGLVLGREGPTIHIGASVASMLIKRFRLGATARSGLLASGAAAGLACAFNAPVAGVLFVIEETRRQFPYRFDTYMAVILASLLATVMTQLIGGRGPDLSMSAAEMPLSSLPLFVLLGCLLGGIGVLLNAGILRGLALAGAVGKRVPYLYPAAVGLAVGALLALLPDAVTGGEGLIPGWVRANPGTSALLMLSAIRFCTTIASYSVGAPGGIFAPILSLAACVGLAFAGVVHMIVPAGAAGSGAFAIAAMGGLFTASVRSPMVGVVLTLELTGAYAVTLPLVATCLAASLVARALGGSPIYEQLLDRTLRLAGATPPRRAQPPPGAL